MLTIRTAGQIRTAGHIRSFRSHPTSTGISLERNDCRRRAWETLHLAVRELRREWLGECWTGHLLRVQNARNKS